MLRDVSWLVYGPIAAETTISPVILMSKLLSVSKYRNQKESISSGSLKDQIKAWFGHDKSYNTLKQIVDDYIEALGNEDDCLAYFVLFCTAQMNPSSFVHSLYERCLSHHMVILLVFASKLLFPIAGRLNRHIERIPGSPFSFQNSIPCIPWDITSSLQALYFPENKEVPLRMFCGPVVTAAGQLSSSFTKLLRDQAIRKEQEIEDPLCLDVESGHTIKYFIFDRLNLFSNLFSMYEGISSELFQLRDQRTFFVRENSEVRDVSVSLRIREVQTLLSPHTIQANRIMQLETDLLTLQLTDLPGVVVDSCRHQITLLRSKMKEAMRGISPVYQVLNKVMEIAQNVEYLLLVCKKCLFSTCSDFEMSTSISLIVRCNGDPYFRNVLNEINKHIILSLTTVFLSLPSTSNSQNNYLSKLFGDIENLEDKTAIEVVSNSRLLRLLSDNLHSSEDYDQLYADSVRIATTFDNLEKILSSSDTLGLDGMLKSVLRPLSSPITISALVSDYLEAIKLISIVFLPLSSHRMLQAKEVTTSTLAAFGVTRRHILRLKSAADKITYEAPPPLDLIITLSHSNRFTVTRDQFLQLSAAYKALLEINLRSCVFCPGEDRIAMFRRDKMLSIVRNMLSHVVSMVRIIRDEMEVQLTKVTCLLDLMNIQRRLMRQLFNRTRLETKNTSTSRIITLIAEYCSFFAAAFVQGDARSCDIHFEHFYDCIRVLSEKLATETDNNAKMLLVKFDRWGLIDTRRSETTTRSIASIDSTSS